ncbi:MAG: hypothetical protein LBU11_02750 [Zoogloeaceae bacterium]|jgi:hypothetical protein|nr:hypothetical protein [Zoogloeaceae bacterium]
MGDTLSPSPDGKGIPLVIIASAIFVLFCSSSPAGGIFAFLLAIPFSFWALFQIARAVSHAENRKRRLLRAGIWFFAFALVAGIHVVRDKSMRQEADAMVAKILAYQEEHGTCPPTLEAIQKSQKSFRDKLGYGSYACQEAQPILIYTTPFNGFDRYRYDFERKVWNYVPD